MNRIVERPRRRRRGQGKPYLQTALGNRKGMLVGELLAFLHFRKDLITCNGVCRGFRNLITPRFPFAVRYNVLFADQAIDLDEQSRTLLTRANTIYDVAVVFGRVVNDAKLVAKELVGNQPGFSHLGKELIDQKWPVDNKVAYNFKLSMIEYYDSNAEIWSFRLRYKNGSRSKVLGYRNGGIKINNSYEVPQDVKIGRVKTSWSKYADGDGKIVFLLKQFKLIDDKGKLLYIGGKTNDQHRITPWGFHWVETRIPKNETFVGLRT